jgi:hypothetical protein
MTSLEKAILDLKTSVREIEALGPATETFRAIQKDYDVIMRISAQFQSTPIPSLSIHNELNSVYDELEFKVIDLISKTIKSHTNQVLGQYDFLYTLDQELREHVDSLIQEQNPSHYITETKHILSQTKQGMITGISEGLGSQMESLALSLRHQLESDLVDYISEFRNGIEETKKELATPPVPVKETPALPPVPPPRTTPQNDQASIETLTSGAKPLGRNAELMANLNRMLNTPSPALPPREPAKPNIPENTHEETHHEDTQQDTHTHEPVLASTRPIEEPVEHEEQKTEKKKKKGIFSNIFGKPKSKSSSKDNLHSQTVKTYEEEKSAHTSNDIIPQKHEEKTVSTAELPVIDTPAKPEPPVRKPVPLPSLPPSDARPVPPPRKVNTSNEILHEESSPIPSPTPRSPVSPKTESPSVPKSPIRQSLDYHEDSSKPTSPVESPQDDVPKPRRIPGAVALPGHGAFMALVNSGVGKPTPSRTKSMHAEDEKMSSPVPYSKESVTSKTMPEYYPPLPVLPLISSPPAGTVVEQEEQERVEHMHVDPLLFLKKKESAIHGDDKYIEKVYSFVLNNKLTIDWT